LVFWTTGWVWLLTYFFVVHPVVKTKDSAATAKAVAKPGLEIRVMGDTPFLLLFLLLSTTEKASPRGRMLPFFQENSTRRPNSVHSA
jgi:hypothetical protein